MQKSQKSGKPEATPKPMAAAVVAAAKKSGHRPRPIPPTHDFGFDGI